MNLRWTIKALARMEPFRRAAVIGDTRYGRVCETACYLGYQNGEAEFSNDGKRYRIPLDDLDFVAPHKGVHRGKV